jgi:protein-L-isoaspartate(D-aspartate) O-methyltransferase
MTPVRCAISIFVLIAFYSCAKQHQNPSWSDIKRKEMVTQQIVSRGITDQRVIDAMLTVERHKFVPEQYEKSAYEDYPLPIGEGQTISQPYIVALMTECVNLCPTDRVLEIGTGSGYQAAVLSLLARDVYTIELIPSLAQSAEQRLTVLGYDNVHVRCGDGFLGWPEAAPFNAIVITCAPPDVPEPLIEQLAEGGRLIVPLGEDFQVLTLFEKTHGELKETSLIPVRFVPMKGMIEEEQ